MVEDFFLRFLLRMLVCITAVSDVSCHHLIHVGVQLIDSWLFVYMSLKICFWLSCSLQCVPVKRMADACSPMYLHR